MRAFLEGRAGKVAQGHERGRRLPRTVRTRRRLRRRHDRAARRRQPACCARPSRCSAYPARLTDRLEHWAREAPDRTLRRPARAPAAPGARISYAQMLDRARRVGQALLDARPVGRAAAGHPVGQRPRAPARWRCGAMWAGVPYAPVSPAYSLVSQDYAQAAPHPRHADAGPGVRQRRRAYAQRHRRRGAGRRRRGRCWPQASSPARAHARRFAALLATDARRRRRAPRTRRSAPTPSPSSCSPRARPSSPKGVINTQRMMCANQQMLRQCLRLPGRRAAGAGRLAAVEPHLRRQPQRRHRALQRRHAVHRRRQAHAEGHRRRRCATCARSRRRSTSTCPRASRRSRARWTRDAALRDMLFARVQGLHVRRRRACRQAVWDQLDRACRGDHRRAHRASSPAWA